MRYSQFLRELIAEYNNNPDSLEERCQVVSEAQASLSRRYQDHQEPIFFEAEPNGSFWIIPEDKSTYWLLPKANLQINEYNYIILETLFEIRGYREGYPTDFRVIRPAKLVPISVEETEYLEHEARGIIEFEGSSNLVSLGESLIQIEAKFKDLEKFVQVSLDEIRNQQTLPQELVWENLSESLGPKLNTLVENLLQSKFAQTEKSQLYASPKNSYSKMPELSENQPSYSDFSLLDKLFFVDHSSALPGGLIPPIIGDSPGLIYKGQFITPLIPLNPKILEHCTPEELIGAKNEPGKLKFESINQGTGVRVFLELPLASAGVYPQEKKYTIKPENALRKRDVPVLELWQIYQADSWRQYYILYSKVQEVNTFKVKLPNLQEDNSFSHQGRLYYLAQLSQFPVFIECRNEEENFLGMILIKTPETVATTKEKSGLEFSKLEITNSQKPDDHLDISQCFMYRENMKMRKNE